jgi:signal transduction histidine kinase
MPIIFASHKIGEIKLFGDEDFLTEGYHHDFVKALSTTIGVLIKNAELQGQVRTMALAEERRHLARELHDSVTQSLFSASLAVVGLHTYFEKNEDLFIQKAIRLLQDQLDQVRSQMRGLILELRPVELENQSLEEAVLGHAASLERSTHLHVTCNLEGCIDKLPYEIKFGLNRIIQESLSNIARHAQAKHVWISLTCKNEAISLQVRDDGKGFDPADNKLQVGSYGLSNIRERTNLFGGISEIISELGAGTTILVEIPLNKEIKDRNEK